MKKITTILALAAFGISARGQGFLNLNFESAQNLTNNVGHGVFVAVTNALPGWTVYNASYITYVTNRLDLGGTVELVGGSAALSGNFSVWLGDSVSISQTGLVPGDTESLLFEAQGTGPGGSLGAGNLGVTLGGQTLSFSTLSEGPNYWMYGVNIPAGLAGQMEALTFFTQGVGSGNLRLDNIEFSPVSVPEPSELALIGLGAILFGLCRRRKQKRHCKSADVIGNLIQDEIF